MLRSLLTEGPALCNAVKSGASRLYLPWKHHTTPLSHPSSRGPNPSCVCWNGGVEALSN